MSAHGAALRQAWATERTATVGDTVEFFQMAFPCNGTPGPGPHAAKVTAVNQDRTLHLRVRWTKDKTTDERFVSHRGMADGGRFWDFRSELRCVNGH